MKFKKLLAVACGSIIVACAVPASDGAGHHAVHYYHNNTSSTSVADAEHHDYDDSGNATAKPNYAVHREHHKVQAPSEEGKEGKANHDDNRFPIAAGAESDNDHHHKSAAAVVRQVGLNALLMGIGPRRHGSRGGAVFDSIRFLVSPDNSPNRWMVGSIDCRSRDGYKRG